MKDSTFGGVYLGVYTEEQDLCIKHQHEACRSERPNSICPLSDRTNIKYYSSSPPKVHTLQRCKGQGRDAGFWLKVISPGGSKTFKRRRNQYVSDINKENRLPSTDEDISPSELEVFSPTSDEVFTDNWEKALQWSSEEFEKFQSTTLPRNHKCQLPSVRQSLPGMMKTTAFRCSSPVPISNSMSPYNFLKTRIINRASRLSSPSKGSQKYLKTDLTNRDLPSHLSFKCRSKAYSHSRTSSCSEKSQTADNPNDDIEASIRLLAEDYSSCTLPRPGLTQLPPTPLSPRRHTSSTWKSRLSATAKELQAISANTLNAIAGSQSSDAVLHGHDVVIDWVGEGGVAAAEKKWPRKHSLPRHYQRQQQPPSHAATASDNEGGGSVGSSDCSAPSEGSAGDRVQGWATSLEKLLDDPAGLHTFAEFLKKEYSHENIYFWTACERYRLGIGSESPTPCSGSSSERPWAQWSGRHACAAAIYNTHLGNNASEPVNVDSQARQVAQEGLHQPTQDLFAAAQKQVFNLMKFDSYSRFLKSGLYQECLEREARGDCHQFAGEEALDPNLRIHQQSPTVDQQHNNNNNFTKGKNELEERRRRSLLPWHRNKDRSKSKDRLHANNSDNSRLPNARGNKTNTQAGGATTTTTTTTTTTGGGSGTGRDTCASSTRDNNNTIGKAKGLSVSASRLGKGSSATDAAAPSTGRSNSVTRTPGSRHPSESSGSLGRTSEVSGSRTSLNSGSDGILLMGGRKAISKESLTSSECLSLSGGEGSGSVTGRCRVVLPDRSQSVVAVRSGVTVERVMRRLLDKRGLPFLAFNVLQAKGEKLVPGTEDSSVLCSSEVRLQQLVLFRLDLPNQKTVCVKAKPHKMASDVLRPILAKYGFKLDLMHIHTMDDPRPINVKGPIADLDGQKFIIQTKDDVKEWGVSVLSNGTGATAGSAASSESDTLDAITNRVFEDLLHSKSSHQLLNNCDYDARSTKTDQGSEHSGGIRPGATRHSLLNDKPVLQASRVAVAKDVIQNTRGLQQTAATSGGRGANTSTPTKDNDELYEGLKRAQMSRIEDQRGTEINSELPDFLKCDSERMSSKAK